MRVGSNSNLPRERGEIPSSLHVDFYMYSCNCMLRKLTDDKVVHSLLIQLYNRSKKYNKTSSPPTDKHSISYKGETFEEVGSEGHWHEFYSKKTGMKIRKHSFKNTIEEVQTSEKKFNAAAAKVVA